MGKEEKSTIISLSSIAAIATILAALATLIGLFVAVKDERRELSLQIISLDKLVYVSKLPNLKANFIYNGRKVDDLVSLKFKLVNTGTKTIVGDGQNKDIIKNAINLVIPDYLKILDYKVDEDLIKGGVDIIDKRKISIKFSQWRTSEYLVLTIYLAGTSRENREPKVYTEDRDIIDGNIVIEDRKEYQLRNVRYIDRILGKGVIGILKFIGFVSILFIFFFPATILTFIARDYYDRIKWFGEYKDKYFEFVDRLKDYKDHEKRNIKLKPNTLKKDLWKQFQGESYPSMRFIDDRKELLIFGISSIGLLLISMPIIVISLYYL